MGFILPITLGGIIFPICQWEFQTQEEKILAQSLTACETVSCKDKTQTVVSLTPKSIFLLYHTSLTSQLKEHGFFCELNKRRTGLPMCPSGGRGSASTPKVGQSHFGSLLWASMIVAKGAVSKSIQALRISASFPHHLGPRSKAWDGLEPGQSHLRTQAHIDMFPRCILL